VGQFTFGGEMRVDIYSLMYEKLKLKPPIKMFEAFAGIGTQQMALKRLGVPYEIVGFSEIDRYVIKSYHAIHGDDIKNYGDITKMTEIPQCDIFTWSFPCTDLSKAGQRKGMSSGTRSGLVYDVLRLLSETKHLPKVLIMENVPDLIQQKFHRQFGEIQLELENMGYMNYVETLNAKHYGVAQNRDRVFMVSIMGYYSYLFPKKVDLIKRLKDYLEKEVDEKFYLSQKMLDYVSDKTKGWSRSFRPLSKEDDTSYTVTTREGNVAEANFIATPLINNAVRSREYCEWAGIAPTLLARDYKDPKVIMIPEDTKQGYALAEDGDGIYINRPEQKRGVVQKGMIQTIKANNSDIGVVVAGQMQPKDRFYNRNGKQREEQFETRSDQLANAVLTIDRKNMVLEINNPVLVDVVFKNRDARVYEECSPTINTYQGGNRQPIVADQQELYQPTKQLRIRKLTPREAWRLMGIDDEDFDKASKVCSNSQLYKQAGNAIVVDVFEAILREMIDLDGDESE
jgi:DNA (cytosine-5)-methyltransferase 1